jgi:hypothetical protein
MKRITLTLLVAAAFAACAQADIIPTLTLIPSSGIVGSGPGTVVGWGFTIAYTASSDWIVLVSSDFTGSDTYGTYVDYLSGPTAPLYVAGPAPESSTISESWDSSASLGLGEFDIRPTALPGVDIPGSIQVDYDVFSQDPNDPNFDPGSFVTEGTVSASAQVDVTPEPAPFLMMSSALLLFTCAGWRRRKVRRS